MKSQLKNLKSSRSDIKVFERHSDINKQKLARFKVLSSRNKENMKNILDNMILIRDSMMRSTTKLDFKALHTVNAFGKNMSNNLKRRIQFSNDIIRIYSDDEKLMNIGLVYKKNKSNYSNNSKREKIELNDLKDEFDLTKDCFKKKSERRKNEKYLKSLKQMRKLRKLKGEILMKDHKKKYSINKTFEPKKEVSSNKFYRDDNKNADAKSRYLDCFKPKILDNYYSLTDIKTKKKKITLFNSQNQLNDNKTLLNNNTINSHYSTLNNTNISDNQISKNFKLKLLNENRPFSSLNSNNNSFLKVKNSNNNKKSKAKKLYNYISTIENIAISNGNEITRNYPIKNEKIEEIEKSNSENISEISNNSNLDIKKINKDFGFNPNDFKLQSLNEENMVAKNAQKVIRKIDNFGKEILNYAIKKMFYDDLRLNNKFYMDSLYERKLNKIKTDKEIKKLGIQALSLEKKYSSHGNIVPKNEKREILKILKDEDKKKWSDDYLKDLIRKCNVLKSIHGKIIKIEKDKSRKCLSDDSNKFYRNNDHEI